MHESIIKLVPFNGVDGALPGISGALGVVGEPEGVARTIDRPQAPAVLPVAAAVELVPGEAPNIIVPPQVD
jgi:hypothetical protein